MKKINTNTTAGAIHSQADQETSGLLLRGGAATAARSLAIVAIPCILCQNKIRTGITMYTHYQVKQLSSHRKAKHISIIPLRIWFPPSLPKARSRTRVCLQGPDME